ncbi:uncharacterized protein LOC142355983, partial [Convolutriloba macropyga]|uniref:uncharacterized protein LOC142355983 n=1 Tax=Convolutriloba macropyga TaxID=536237 RepID=UPI003F51BB8E
MRRIMIFRGSSFAPCLRNRQNQRSKNIFDVARNRFSSSSTVSGRSYVESAIRQNWKDRQDLAACYRLLNDWTGYQKGEVFNHLSVRTKSSNPDHHSGGDVLLLIAEGCHWTEVTASNLVEVDVQTGFQVVGDGKESTTGKPILTASVIHSGLHRDRPESKALFHLHPTYATIIACQ